MNADEEGGRMKGGKGGGTDGQRNTPCGMEGNHGRVQCSFVKNDEEKG